MLNKLIQYLGSKCYNIRKDMFYYFFLLIHNQEVEVIALRICVCVCVFS